MYIHSHILTPSFIQWVARAIESAREFFHEHVREPSQGAWVDTSYKHINIMLYVYICVFMHVCMCVCACMCVHLSSHTHQTAIAKELIWNEHTAITDVAALEDAKKSLSRMLEVPFTFTFALDSMTTVSVCVCLFVASCSSHAPIDRTQRLVYFAS